MFFKKAFIICLIILTSVLGMLYYFGHHKGNEGQDNTEVSDTNTIYIWYTDERIADYLSSAAVAYLDEYNVRVVPEYHSGLELLEEINRVSLKGAVKNDDGTVSHTPDLYITGTDSIEKAAMAGLAIPVPDEKAILNLRNYPEVALNAITYKNEKFGYPFYYETAYLLYNETYIKNMADQAMRTEIATGEEAETATEDDEGMQEAVAISDNQVPPEGYSEYDWGLLVAGKMQTMIPSAIEDILDFANTYSPPEEVENIFVWDVSDIFYNYFFTGAYMDIGGTNGDDPEVLQIYNTETITCMEVYQGLNQFFSIDAKTSNYEEVLDDFIHGKTIFTIATTDALAAIDQAKFDGTFTWDYNVASLPGVDSEHEARGLSTTDAVIINGFTTHRHEADGFARFVTSDYIDSFFSRTGKLAVANGSEDYIVDSTDLVRDMYKVSVPLPKLLSLSNFWVELELAYTKIWQGDNPDSILADLQVKMENQLKPN